MRGLNDEITIRCLCNAVQTCHRSRILKGHWAAFQSTLLVSCQTGHNQQRKAQESLNVGRQNTSSFQTGSMKNLWKMTKTTTINNSCLFRTLSYQCSFTFHSAINCHCKPHTNPCDIKTDVSIKVENELCGVQFVTCSNDAFDFFTDLIGFII